MAVSATLAFASLAQAPKPPAQNNAASAPQPAQIDRNGVLILIRSTILALDQANKTGNYTVLRDLGAPGFQTNTAARLAEIFASQRRDNLDLSGVAVIDPQLTILPQIEANGMMRMAGFFPSVPQQVNFEMLFSPVSGQWRLFGISVNVGQTGPVAPQPATSPPPSPAPQTSAAPPYPPKPATAAASKPAAKPSQPRGGETQKEKPAE
jgi:cell division septation protein DedD